MGEFEVSGGETGRTWRARIAATLPFAGNGFYRRGEGEEEVVLLHELPKEEMYADDIARARQAIDVFRRPEVREAPTIRQLIDIFENDHVLVLVYEWADESLHERLGGGHLAGAEAKRIEANVSAALAVLHGLGLAHCDVAPNNVLDVGGVWKLADLDNCVTFGKPVTSFPPERYRHPEAVPGASADAVFDLYGLEQIGKRLRDLG
jgi:serine/threonine protein kinase